MAIPDYQSLMLPVLKLASDGNEHRNLDAVDTLAKSHSLTAEELEKLLPSGKQAVFPSRVYWAKTYLVQAKLLEATRRGRFKITERGRAVLAENPSRIDARFLRRFPEFVAFVQGTKSDTASTEPVQTVEEVITRQSTPDELLRTTITEMNSALASDLIERICSASPAFFERLVVDLLLAMGYGGSRSEAGRAIGKSGDGGIDGVIDQDQLGLDQIYIQAKRYDPESGVGEPEIRGFSGSLGANKASKGVFVTTSYYTKPARDFAERHPAKIVLIDGAELARLMIRHNVGARSVETLHIKKVDEDFFPEEE